jgi:O-succinylbenzoic acid--CoA ligase
LGAGSALNPGEDDETDPTALVVATSGSTGEPKGALLQASALRASAGATQDRLGGPGQWLLALAPHHVAGVQVLVRSLLAGTVPVRLDLTARFTADGFASAARLLDGAPDLRRYTALVPTQLVRLLEAGGEALEQLASFDAVLLGGAAATPALLARAAAAGVHVVTTYGMSETCGGCVYDGLPLDGVGVDVGDRIRLGGAVVARGYRGRPDAAQFAVENDTRWFTTDDVGVLDGDRLTVLGRADDVITTGGVKVAPQAVEAVVAHVDGVRECLVVGLPDDEWGQRVVALLVGDVLPSLETVRRAVSDRLGAAAAPRDLVPVDALPAKALGKPDRAAAARLAAEVLRGG